MSDGSAASKKVAAMKKKPAKKAAPGKKRLVGVEKPTARPLSAIKKSYALCASYKSTQTKNRTAQMEIFLAVPPQGEGSNGDFMAAVTAAHKRMHALAMARLGSDTHCLAFNVTALS
jgi:hypothetical protein